MGFEEWGRGRGLEEWDGAVALKIGWGVALETGSLRLKYFGSIVSNENVNCSFVLCVIC